MRTLLLSTSLRFLISALGFLYSSSVMAQTTCTMIGTGTIDWVGTGTGQYSCTGSGNPTTLTIPAGVTVNFDSNNDTWTGTTIIVYGFLNITFSGSITINATIHVQSTGRLFISSKLYLGTTSGCGHRLIVESGGRFNLPEGGADDRLYICGNKIAQSGGQCYPYPGNQLPFCEPDPPNDYFAGPFNWDQDGGITPTPVTLINFDVAREGAEKVRVYWSTATEHNADYFSVERSYDGKTFLALEKVPAAGESHTRLDYELIDHYPLIGRNYYRLKQVDFDGTTEYFPMKFIDLTGSKRVMIYPTLLENNEIKIKLNFTTEQVAHASIISVAGREVANFDFTGTEFRAPVGLSTGAYLLKVNIGAEQFLERFVVR